MYNIRNKRVRAIQVGVDVYPVRILHRGGFGFHLALRDSGEEASQGGAEIASGHIAAGIGARGHRAGGSRDPPLQLPGVERAEMRMAVATGSTAQAAIGNGERTQRGTVLGAIGGHGKSPERKIRFGIFWRVSRKRDALLNEESLPPE